MLLQKKMHCGQTQPSRRQHRVQEHWTENELRDAHLAERMHATQAPPTALPFLLFLGLPRIYYTMKIRYFEELRKI